MPKLADAIVELHRRLDAAGLPHAFGGAQALAYCTRNPRATKDIDVNVFVGLGHAELVLDALPEGVTIRDSTLATLGRDGQVRVWWDDVPVDLYLSNHWFHGAAEARRRTVPFADVSDLPVLACEDLAVFKTFFARPKDAVDLAEMVKAGAVSIDQLAVTLDRLLGAGARTQFLDDVRRFSDEPDEGFAHEILAP